MADVFKIKKQEAPYYLCDICGKIRLIEKRNEIQCEVSNEILNERDYLEKFRSIDSLQVCNDCLSEVTKDDLNERIDKLEKEINYLQGRSI